jgi:hypothetical protein
MTMTTTTAAANPTALAESKTLAGMLERNGITHSPAYLAWKREPKD